MRRGEFNMMTMNDAIERVVKGQNLSLEESKDVMRLMMGGNATQAQLGSFLTALRIKGETLDEMIGCATVMKEMADHVTPKVATDYVDLVGTGGDGTNTFNISTTSALVAAGAGVPIAKHGNRAISSNSGAADVFEALGVNVMLEANSVEKCIEETGIGFMFAQVFHKAMKNVGQARKEMGIRTIFNILGPLSNPSDAKATVIGVFKPELAEPFAKALSAMGVTRGLVVAGMDGMDEITTTTDTFVVEINNADIKSYKINPKDFGVNLSKSEDIRGGKAEDNAKITLDILKGEKGSKRDIVLLNAGATIYVGGLADSISEGINIAAKSIDSGLAMQKLEAIRDFTNRELAYC